MDLKSFVAETLVQIQEGVQLAIDRRFQTDRAAGAINPDFGKFHQDTEKLVDKVTFDVAVTAVDTAESGKSGGLKVLSIEMSGKATKATENSVVSRIQFSVRLLPPTTKVHPDRDEHNESVIRGAPKHAVA